MLSHEDREKKVVLQRDSGIGKNLFVCNCHFFIFVDYSRTDADFRRKSNRSISGITQRCFRIKSSIATTFGKTVPLLFVGLACAFSNKAGLFNIGCEGQLYIGSLTAAATAIALQGMPRVVIISAAFLTGMLAGALVGGMNGFLKAKLQISEVLVAIMMNYIF